jgi:tetratricopeptide (TPR) repeat protein
MTRTDSRREQQVLKLLREAQDSARAGRLDEALAFQANAIELSRVLAERFPADPRHRESIASGLYGQAGILARASRPADAVEALAESEQLYRSITGLAGIPDTAPLIADVGARRARALAADGRGGSAVPEAEAAVAFYEQYEQAAPTADVRMSRRRDLARVCATNAEILTRFGDPDVAVACADRALRLYLSRERTQPRFAIGPGDVGYLVTAASVAATIHGWHGRIDVSLAAARLALRFADLARLRDPLRTISARVDRMTLEGRTDFGQAVATALRDRADPGGDDAQTAADVITVFRKIATRRMPAPSAGSDRLTTLVQALGHAGHAELGSDITAPALDCAITTPAGRCSPELAPGYARRLAELAVSVLPGALADGVRIGLEAHYLYAAASAARVPAMRYQFAEFGPAWARVLLACSAAFEHDGDLRMALDLASWAAGTAMQLAPLAPLNSGVLVSLVRQCVECHGRMLLATGDRENGTAALAQARAIGAPPAGPR